MYCAVQRVKYKIIKEETFKGEQEEAFEAEKEETLKTNLLSCFSHPVSDCLLCQKQIQVREEQFPYFTGKMCFVVNVFALSFVFPK